MKQISTNIQISLFHILLFCSISSINYADASLPENICSNQEIFEGKRIAILGGTGYLGRAIGTEVLKYNPKQVIVFSRDEVKHFYVLSKTFNNNPKVTSVLGDIRDYEALLKATRNVDIVFHVAALKRMDCLEDNVEEAIKTDVLGSINVFNACVANNVKRVLFISTDKACSPINTYGACKFVSEKVFTNYNTQNYSTKFMAVRFGNILDSTGSVIPIFIDKIKSGQDITLTDDRMTRFIIDKSEAIDLIFDALRYGQGGEIFIKRLSAMKITDLIDVLKEKLNANNQVRVIGLRPGEKLHEIMINESEIMRAFAYKNFFIITPSIPQWIANHADDLPIYLKHKVRVNERMNKEYSSGDETISQEKLADLLVKHSFIQ